MSFFFKASFFFLAILLGNIHVSWSSGLGIWSGHTLSAGSQGRNGSPEGFAVDSCLSNGENSGLVGLSPPMVLARNDRSGNTRSGAKVTEVKPSRQSASEPGSRQPEKEKVWRSQELEMLAVGLGVGDVDGDGANELVIIDPQTVYLYKYEGGTLRLVTQYSAGALELKSVDVAKLRKQGPPRIYISAQNRGMASSMVLEYRNGTLVPVVEGYSSFLRVLLYPTVGPILLGQKKSLRKMYEGPIMRLADKGDGLEVTGRFGVPLKIPIFGFTVGDFDGSRKPLIAVYDRNDHLRMYTPDGKRLYVSKGFFGGSDIILRWQGPEMRGDREASLTDEEKELVHFRPRIMAADPDGDAVYEILVVTHSSKTMRVLSRTKMLEEGQVKGLRWNGDAVEEKWSTPKIGGTIADFALETLPGLPGRRLITLERKKTDWLAFLRSKSQVRAYDLDALIKEGAEHLRRDDED